MRSRPLALATTMVLLATGLALPRTASAQPASAQRASGTPHGCDPIDTALCLLPFPNDWFTVADGSTATHRRVDLSRGMMPRNRIGIPVDPTEYDRNDGFSPGTAILAQLPGLDLARSGAAPVTDIGSSLLPDAPIVVLNTRTGQRLPYWAELDSHATDPARRALIIHPAKRLDDGSHYAIALRDLRDSTGALIQPSQAFQTMLAPVPPKDSGLAERWRELHPVLHALRTNGIGSQGLDLAWDFTTSSTRSLTERALHMRDESFARLGKSAPTVLITSVKDTTPQQDPLIARRVKGVVLVPSYLGGLGGPSSRLHYPTAHPGPDTLPEPSLLGVLPASFQCDIPQAALKHPARPVLFGHGLFQDQSVVDVPLLTRAANAYDVVFCGAAWLGLSTADLPFLGLMTGDLSSFPSVPDRMQQAYLDFLFLGRWLAHPQGIRTNWAFRNLVDTSNQLVYGGYSLGGVEGGALTALAQDWHRSWLGVPGMEFSTLLNRSVDFSQYQQLLDVTYPDPLSQQVGLALLQMIWDRGEGDGYITHVIQNPLPATPVHQILVQNIYGDHQVANVSSQIEARTLGIPVRAPILAPGRDASGFWGIPQVSTLPYTGSMMTFWDSGSPTPPTGNVPPSAGHDPHDDVANTPAALDQVLHFFTDGQVVDTCANAPCQAIPY